MTPARSFSGVCAKAWPHAASLPELPDQQVGGGSWARVQLTVRGPITYAARLPAQGRWHLTPRPRPPPRALGSDEPLAREVGRQCRQLRQPQPSSHQSLLPPTTLSSPSSSPPSRSPACPPPRPPCPGGPARTLRLLLPPASRLGRKQSTDQGSLERRLHV